MTDSARADAAAAEGRVLILAPVGRDGRLADQALTRAGLNCHVCGDLAELGREIQSGAGTVLLTEEALAPEPAADPDGWLASEPPWSQLPLVVLTRENRPLRPRISALRRLEQRRNVSFLQRPVPHLTLVSTVRAALENRFRQYALRTLLGELEAAVRQRDKFLATLGHELRNPLGAITTAAALLREETTAANDTIRDASGLIDRQAKNLSRILDDLLEVSRVTHGKLELRRSPAELGHTIRGVLQAARGTLAERRHRLDVRLPGRPVWVEADATRIEQILWNLLSNASKYTDPGGRIVVALASEGDQAVVRVQDDGRGMKPEFVDLAFELFAQAEVGGGGLGLGLPLSRKLAELHGGSLTATSAGLGKGSEFVLRLPRLESPGAEEAAQEAPAPAAEPRRILLVEDNADLGWGMELLLRRLGHEVRWVGTGREAVELAPSYRPEVVLLDMGLPDMHGADVAQHLRAELGGEPLLAAMTGFGQDSVRKRSLESGCDRYMTKPVALADLRELLDGKGKRAGD